MTTFFHFVTAIILFLTPFVHPIHLSVTELEFNRNNSSIEVASKVFADDLEEVIEQNKNVKLNLNTGKEHPETDLLIRDYFLKNLVFRINGKLHVPIFRGREQEKEAVWVYFEIKDVSEFKNLDVRNILLFDLHSDQMNMVHFKSEGRRGSHSFFKGDGFKSF